MTTTNENIRGPKPREWELCLGIMPKACGGIHLLAQRVSTANGREQLDTHRQGVDKVCGLCHAVEKLTKSREFGQLPCQILKADINSKLGLK